MVGRVWEPMYRVLGAHMHKLVSTLSIREGKGDRAAQPGWTDFPPSRPDRPVRPDPDSAATTCVPPSQDSGLGYGHPAKMPAFDRLALMLAELHWPPVHDASHTINKQT